VSRRATRKEREQRLAELSELLAARAPGRACVRYAVERWGLGERAAQGYVAEVRERLRRSTTADPEEERGLALAGYELILRRQLKGGDLRGARATLDKLVALLGLGRSRPVEGEGPITTVQIDAEIARLEAELAALDTETY